MYMYMYVYIIIHIRRTVFRMRVFKMIGSMVNDEKTGAQIFMEIPSFETIVSYYRTR